MSDSVPLLPTPNESDNTGVGERPFSFSSSPSHSLTDPDITFLGSLRNSQTFQDVVFPNFSHYKYLQTLPVSHFSISPHDNKRVVAIGDIHGMNDSLSALLAKISYNPQSDTLINLGDLVSKSENVSSIPTLSFMSTNHILGVRGNNDQKVIKWRAWMHWIESLPGGREWLEDMGSNWSHIDGGQAPRCLQQLAREVAQAMESNVPNGWKLQGKHYKVARKIPQEQFDYLCPLPIVLYAPTVHTYFVHAGLLPADPTRDYDDPKQPLSHLPTTANPDEDDLTPRSLQELPLLNQIPQNHDPQLLMNMRSISKDGRITDSNKKGIPWSDAWDDVMASCSATELITTKHDSVARMPVRCFPSMVIYGHAAAWDLDVERWSVGIDTGCVYGGRLTAVILDAKSLPPQTHSTTSSATSHNSKILYGNQGSAEIVTIKCDG